MTAILDGPFIEDPEFQTRLGLNRLELRQVLATQSLDLSDLPTRLGVNNCLNEIANGVRLSSAEWEHRIGVSKDDVRSVLQKVSVIFKYWAPS
jgi:hypothetical protein